MIVVLDLVGYAAEGERQEPINQHPPWIVATGDRDLFACMNSDLAEVVLKQYVIERWLLKHARMDRNSIIRAQLEQTRARIFFACACLLYLFFHAGGSGPYFIPFLTLTTCYFIINITALYMIKQQPHAHTPWLLLLPALDVTLVSLGMLVDGGQFSGLYFIYLFIIFGNAFRFGSHMQVYTQVLSLTALLVMSAFAFFVAELSIDPGLLLWQTGALIITPLYIHFIKQRVEDAIRTERDGDESSFHLLDKAPLPIFTYAIDQQNSSRILYANAMVKELFHSEDETFTGASVDALTLAEDSHEMLEFCRQAYHQDDSDASGSPRTIYIRGKNRSGEIIKLTATAMRMRWQGRRAGVCFMHDITRREALQEQLQTAHRQGYISTLVAGIVHDFRNVLTNMIGYAEVLHMTSTDAAEKQQINEIIEAGERGSGLITHLLKLSRNRETSCADDYCRGDLLVPRLENIIGLARLQLPLHIQLIGKIQQPLHDVAISITGIEQILLTLINNSAQAIHAGGIIRVEIGPDSDHALAKAGCPALSVKVMDDGEGIAEKDLDLVFKAFWTSKAEQGGSGLGLTMVQRIVKRHHGKITVESIPGKHTCFTIHLPAYIETTTAEPATDTSTAVQSNRQSGANELPSGCHILLVDDGPDVLKTHQAMLTHMGHTSCTAESGQQALELFHDRENTFDLIVTDFRMPGMNGLELVKAIRGQGSDIPILMVTAFGEDEQLREVGKYQVNLINKPVGMEKFSRGLAECYCNRV